MATPWSLEWKEEQLHQLYLQWESCEKCPLNQTRKKVVFGMGNPNAKILFVGEGPGEEEDATGEPFVGSSGKLLRALLSNAKMAWKDVYLTNVIACRPTDAQKKNREPTTAERDACLPRVHEIIYIVDPWIVVPVGKMALKALAKGRDWAITEYRGSVFSSPSIDMKLTGDRNGVEIKSRHFPRTDVNKRSVHLEYDMIPILHPSYLLRDDDFDETTLKFQPDGQTQKTFEDLKRIKKLITRLEEEYASLPKFDRS
jgi:uracil-DNA glycosylase family 4